MPWINTDNVVAVVEKYELGVCSAVPAALWTLPEHIRILLNRLQRIRDIIGRDLKRSVEFEFNQMRRKDIVIWHSRLTNLLCWSRETKAWEWPSSFSLVLPSGFISACSFSTFPSAVISCFFPSRDSPFSFASLLLWCERDLGICQLKANGVQVETGWNDCVIMSLKMLVQRSSLLAQQLKHCAILDKTVSIDEATMDWHPLF